MHQQHPYGASAYRAIGIETGVAASDPLGLVVMLYDGAIQAIVRAEAAIASGDIAARGRYTSNAIDIVQQGLQASLDKTIGGSLAESLASLYDYMGRRLFAANLKGDANVYLEVRTLLADLRASWAALREPVETVKPALASATVRATVPARSLSSIHGRSLAA